MFTAKDMHNKLKMLDHCEGLDQWIETALYKAFVQYGNPAIVHNSEITKQSWNRSEFFKEMAARGFSLEFKSSSHDADYYRITFPPQER